MGGIVPLKIIGRPIDSALAFPIMTSIAVAIRGYAMSRLEYLQDTLPTIIPDEKIIDHLNGGKVYIELDEPDGYVTYDHGGNEDGPWRVARKIDGSYPTIGYFTTLRQALSAAIGLV